MSVGCGYVIMSVWEFSAWNCEAPAVSVKWQESDGLVFITVFPNQLFLNFFLVHVHVERRKKVCI